MRDQLYLLNSEQKSANRIRAKYKRKEVNLWWLERNLVPFRFRLIFIVSFYYLVFLIKGFKDVDGEFVPDITHFKVSLLPKRACVRFMISFSFSDQFVDDDVHVKETSICPKSLNISNT